MTDDAWLKVSKAIVKGFCLMPLIKDNPNRHVAELLDGFRSHENVLEAHELHAQTLIISLKEESNSSYINQEYNQLVAKNDKKNAAESLCDQRRSKKWLTGKSHISQWGLLTTAMDIVRKTTKAIWVSSFEHCNLYPLTRQSFDAFCVKIAPHLCAGKMFKDENVNPTPEEKFALLPSFWHYMSPSERKVVMTVFQVNASKYTPSCLRLLREECNLPLSQMNDGCVCVLVSQEHPGSLNFDVHDLRIKDVKAPPVDLNFYAAKQVSLVDNLNHLILLP
jgi:hypothetical protein